MKVRDFLKQNIEYLNNPNKGKGKLIALTKFILKVPISMMRDIVKDKKTKRISGIFFLLFIFLISNYIGIIPNFYPDILIFQIFRVFANYYVFMVGFFALIALVGIFNSDTRYRRKILRNYKKKMGANITFKADQYAKAAKVLRKFKSIKPEKAYEKYGEDTIELLLLANGIFLNKGEFKRLVSIKSIEQDKEAGWED